MMSRMLPVGVLLGLQEIAELHHDEGLALARRASLVDDVVHAHGPGRLGQVQRHTEGEAVLPSRILDLEELGHSPGCPDGDGIGLDEAAHLAVVMGELCSGLVEIVQPVGLGEREILDDQLDPGPGPLVDPEAVGLGPPARGVELDRRRQREPQRGHVQLAVAVLGARNDLPGRADPEHFDHRGDAHPGHVVHAVVAGLGERRRPCRRGGSRKPPQLPQHLRSTSASAVVTRHSSPLRFLSVKKPISCPSFLLNSRCRCPGACSVTMTPSGARQR